MTSIDIKYQKLFQMTGTLDKSQKWHVKNTHTTRRKSKRVFMCTNLMCIDFRELQQNVVVVIFFAISMWFLFDGKKRLLLERWVFTGSLEKM